MASTRSTLEKIENHLEESMGVREGDSRPRLSPVTSLKDAGRRPLRDYGQVDIDQIIPDPDQPRVEFTQESIDRLGKSIQEKGQLSPIRVRWSENHEKWVIIAGERRWRATKRAGLASIDCYFHAGGLTSSEILEQQLIENCLREDLQPIEEAKAFARLMDLNGWTGKQLAETLRFHPAKVTRTLALLRLPADIQDQVSSGKIAARSAYEISKLTDHATRYELADRAAKGTLTHKQAAEKVRQRRGMRKRSPRNTHLTFSTEEGWKITISAKKKGAYEEVEEALCFVLEEVRHRIRNNVRLL